MKPWRILIAEPENFSENALSILGEVADIDCRTLGACRRKTPSDYKIYM